MTTEEAKTLAEEHVENRPCLRYKPNWRETEWRGRQGHVCSCESYICFVEYMPLIHKASRWGLPKKLYHSTKRKVSK